MESQRCGDVGVSTGPPAPASKARRRVLRRPTSALTTAILGTALMVPDLPAQQMPTAGGATTTGSPTMLARGARYLLRNGWDYITYQEYERALGFFREAEARKAELNK